MKVIDLTKAVTLREIIVKIYIKMDEKTHIL